MPIDHSEAIKARIVAALIAYHEQYPGPEADMPTFMDMALGQTTYIVHFLASMAQSHPRGIDLVDEFLGVVRQDVVHALQQRRWGRVITPPPLGSDGSYN
jgi:hypothetical protein